MQAKVPSRWILVFVFTLFALTSLMCSVFSAPVAQQKEKTEALQATVEAMKSTAQAGVDEVLTQTVPTLLPTRAAQAVPSKAASGGIRGSLSYPSEGIPPLRIVAFRVGSKDWQALEVPQNTFDYVLDGLTPGQYWVVAYTIPDGGISLAGGYTQAVPCGLSVDCTDHSLIAVTVKAGEITAGVDPGDWYVPPETFPADPMASAAGEGSGSISGRLSYPSEMIPPLRVVAFRVNSKEFRSVDVKDSDRYQIDNLPAGQYYVVSYVLPTAGFPAGLAGGYTQAVPCGLSVNCTDHSLMAVNVESGKVSKGIDPADWYAPEGTFPPDPMAN